ncbi:Proteoglycan 4 C-terminal part like [Quillaja saponaria]|uniref:Proteoglycan 4 C-terminal part like n=1 Tax=Quillaja saponaria TaxID=32244 RepID=A0AAD7PAD7_QUISA|nr:Proteoglycan 4 C-terminal part like [Quillaja saponaria]
MAHVSICKAMSFMVIIVELLLATAVTAQDSEFAPAPAPSMDAGTGFPLTFSGEFVCSSLLFSLIAFLWH